VHVYAADHPREPELRRQAFEFSRPVAIGANVWIGGAAILCPGVTVGDDSVVGAGSVVTHDIPAQVVAAGNPCRVIRTLQSG
jgi:maltose O-acetyltransferase